MGIEDLTQLQLLDGIIGLIYPAAGITVGAIIASKYIKYKRKELLFVGLSLAILTISWLALGITFLTIVFFDTPLPDNIYFFIYLAFTPFSTITWIWAMAILLAPNHIKKVVGIFSSICLAYEIYLLFMLFTDPYSILVRVGPMNVDAVSPLISIFALFQITFAIITMIMFVRDCLRSGNPRIIWKGRFLLLSVILLGITTIMVIMNPTDIVIILISRILFIVRLFTSYLGWLLPERVAKMLIKEAE